MHGSQETHFGSCRVAAAAAAAAGAAAKGWVLLLDAVELRPAGIRVNQVTSEA